MFCLSALYQFVWLLYMYGVLLYVYFMSQYTPNKCGLGNKSVQNVHISILNTMIPMRFPYHPNTFMAVYILSNTFISVHFWYTFPHIWLNNMFYVWHWYHIWLNNMFYIWHWYLICDN